MFHHSLFFFFLKKVQISRKALISLDCRNCFNKMGKMLNGNRLCHSLQTLSLTFRQMLAQLTNTRAFKFRYRGMVRRSICNPFCAAVSVPTKCQSKTYSHHLTQKSHYRHSNFQCILHSFPPLEKSLYSYAVDNTSIQIQFYSSFLGN